MTYQVCQNWRIVGTESITRGGIAPTISYYEGERDLEVCGDEAATSQEAYNAFNRIISGYYNCSAVYNCHEAYPVSEPKLYTVENTIFGDIWDGICSIF